jgi:hypothetical protein
MKIGGSGFESGFISQRHGSTDPDPDPHQNVTDLKHCPSDSTFVGGCRDRTQDCCDFGIGSQTL